MKRIYKGQPPSSLIQHKARKGATYSNYREKGDLRDSLLNEQGYICCYCMNRIIADEKNIGMKIEHWASQKHHAYRQLEYANLLGACMGNEGAR